MLKKLTLLTVLVPVLVFAGPSRARAATFEGRITAYSGGAISVLDKEVVTIALDRRTAYSKLITRKPYQEDTRLDARWLRVGRYVVVHTRHDNKGVADWVQIATDVPVSTPPAISTAGSAAGPTVGAAARRAPSADGLSKKELADLIANAKTPEDHLKLAKHYTAVAERYEADSEEHAAEAKAYRRAPSAAETKRPFTPGTAGHCERLADAARAAAAAARDLARDHEAMAAAK